MKIDEDCHFWKILSFTTGLLYFPTQDLGHRSGGRSTHALRRVAPQCVQVDNHKRIVAGAEPSWAKRGTSKTPLLIPSHSFGESDPQAFSSRTLFPWNTVGLLNFRSLLVIGNSLPVSTQISNTLHMKLISRSLGFLCVRSLTIRKTVSYNHAAFFTSLFHSMSYIWLIFTVSM